eukprot:scaffold39105_cov76-Phaeocystis_antarctica.AAC.12
MVEGFATNSRKSRLFRSTRDSDLGLASRVSRSGSCQRALETLAHHNYYLSHDQGDGLSSRERLARRVRDEGCLERVDALTDGGARTQGVSEGLERLRVLAQEEDGVGRGPPALLRHSERVRLARQRLVRAEQVADGGAVGGAAVSGAAVERLRRHPRHHDD